MVVSVGNTSGGFSLFVQDGRPHVVFAHLGRREYALRGTTTLPAGKVELRLRFDRTRDCHGRVTLSSGDTVSASSTTCRPTR